MLYYIILYYIILYYIILYYIILYYIILYIILYYIILYYILYCIVLYCIVLYCIIFCSRIMQACCDMAFEYAHSRECFGTKIGHFQVRFLFIMFAVVLCVYLLSIT